MSVNVAALKKKALELEQKRQFDKALALYVKVIEVSGDASDQADVALFNRVGDLFVKQGQMQEALSYYERAVDLYADGGFYNNAIALCNKILRQSPGRASIYYKLGRISAQKGFRNEAKTHFLEYAGRMQKAGDLDEAFRALAEFADLCPDQYDLRLMLAEQLLREGRKEQAVRQLQVLYERQTADGDARGAQATRERMRAIDPSVEPIAAAMPTPAAGSATTEKSSDLVFLDLEDFATPPRPAAPPPPSVAPKVPPPAPPSKSNELAFLDLDDAPPAAPPPPVATPEPEPVLELSPEPEPLEAIEPLEATVPASLDVDALPVTDETPLLELEPTSLVAEDTLPTIETPVAELPVIETPVAELPMIETPVAELPMIETPVAELPAVEPMEEEPSAMAEEAVDGLVVGGLAETVEMPIDGTGLLEHTPRVIEAFSEEGAELPSLDDNVAATEPFDALDGEALGVIEGADEYGTGEEVLGIDPLSLLDSGVPDVPDDGSAEARPASPLDDLLPMAARVEEQAGPGLLDDLLTMRAETPAGELAVTVDAAALRPTLAAPLDALDAIDATEASDERGTAEGVAAPEEAQPDAAVMETEASDAEAPAEEGATADVEALDLGLDIDPEIAAVLAAAEETPKRRSTTVLARSVESVRLKVEQDPENWDLRRTYAEVLLDDGDREAGLAELDATMVGYERADDLISARSVADEIVRLMPNSVRHHQKRVEYCFRSQDRAGLVDAYVELADALLREGQPDKARAVYQRVIELAPGEARATAALESLVAPAPELPAPVAPRTTAAARRYTGTLETPMAGAAVPPPEPPPADDDEYVDLGAFLLDDEPRKSTRMVVADEEPTGDEEADFQDMLQKFKQGIAENVEEEDYAAHYDLGVAFKEMGLVDEAIAEFQKALRGPDHRVRAHEALGQCFIEKEMWPVAATILGRVAEERTLDDAQLINVLYLLGQTNERLGRTAEALLAYQRVYAVDIGFADVADRVQALMQGQG